MRKILIGSILTVASLQAAATPWIGTLDPQLHNDLVTLTEYRALDSVVNTYPVPWKGIANQLKQLDESQYPEHVRLAVLRLRHYLRQEQLQSVDSYLELYGASDPSRFTAFNGEQRPSALLTNTTEVTSGRWSAQLSVNLEPGGERNLDQSYVAVQVADWTLAVSAMDQWWGPAHATSLILTDNARPVPSVGISRATTEASKSKWLSWLGSWYFTAQLGQLESERAIPDTRLWRTRLTFSPVKGLELGAAWSAMWGGEGQPNGFSDFIDVITFQNICADGSSSCDSALFTKQGNHIAGFDLKYSFMLADTPMSLYAQRVGEDAIDTYRVTDNAYLYGFSTYWQGAKLYLETSDTNVACGNDGSDRKNCYYESSIYPDGYRYYDRAIGSTFDSDAKHITFGGYYHPTSRDLIGWQLSKIELNPDGEAPSPLLTDSVEEELWYVSGYYQTAWRDWQIKIGGNIAQREFNLDQRDNETDYNLYLHLRYAITE
ncbi:capsule assembly Wzi family protein [Alteromonas sp. ASW11-36]|uniref:Capsule assembly Wzi family protein n=1 Tax=Alteromonas arenosi TaxID=3055817 RepID=A0ABT7SSV9_9ALTE|nr:capsule assembly Wzi family protein [Alteromonas sp. ASW11-36]MDM7859276.1 capsule assembly Wzi family protein [Alteromonas sp. ASW11-36]